MKISHYKPRVRHWPAHNTINGKWFQAMRQGRNITVAQVAGRAGILMETLQLWEGGKRKPHPRAVIALSAALKQMVALHAKAMSESYWNGSWN